MLQKRGSHTVIDKTNYYGVWIGMETEADSVRSLLKICRQGGLESDYVKRSSQFQDSEK